MVNKQEQKVIHVTYKSEVPSRFTGIVIYKQGDISYYVDGEIQKTEGPCTDCKYCNSDRQHLCFDPGPAILHTDNYKEWCLNGEPHRLNGPAIKWPRGAKDYSMPKYYLFGEELCFHEHQHFVNLIRMGYPRHVILWLMEKRFDK